MAPEGFKAEYMICSALIKAFIIGAPSGIG